ncbi:MAG: polysaccharide biosynthesis/export family protein [Sphingobium sp.]
MASRIATGARVTRRLAGLCASATCVLLSACSTSEKAPAGAAAYAVIPVAHPPIDYAIGAGDILRIQIYHEPSLSLEDAEVSAAGTVRLALAGDVPVAGLSANDAADAIAGRFARYLRSPHVTIFVKKAVSRRVTMDGEVRMPGLYPIEGSIGLLQAVALAGGPSRAASLDHIVIVRVVEGKRMAARFDLAAIRKGEAPDPAIRPGDLVIVGFSRLNAILGGTLAAAPALAAGFVALEDGD